MKRYEERSNPLMKFVEEFCEEAIGENTQLRDLTNSCNEFLKSKHLRIMTARQIGKILRDEGFSVSQRKIDDVTSVVILNLKILEKPLEPLEPSKVPLEAHVESSRDHDGSNGSTDLLMDFTDEEIKQAGYTREFL